MSICFINYDKVSNNQPFIRWINILFFNLTRRWIHYINKLINKILLKDVYNCSQKKRKECIQLVKYLSLLSDSKMGKNKFQDLI
jgi:hypothetical protein